MAESFKDIIDEFKNINKETQKLVSSIGSMSDRQTAALQNIADILENDLPSPIPPSETDTTATEELSRTNSVLSQIGNVLTSDFKSLLAPIAGIARAIPGLTTATKIGSILVKAVIKPKNNSRDSEDRQEADADREEQKTLLQTMVDGIINLNKSFLKGLATAGGMGLGVIAGLIAAPVIMLVSFFKSLGAEFKTLTNITKSLAGGKLFAPIRLLFKGLTLWTKGLVRITDMVTNGSVSKIGGVLGKVFGGIAKVFGGIATGGRSLAGFFSKIGKVVMKGINFIVNIGTKIVSFFSKFSSFAKGFSGSFKMITTFAAGFGTILGKIFLPITILMSAFDFITGFMDGYSEGGILGGLEGGLSKVFANLIGMPLDLLKSAVSWIAGVFGFSGVESALDSFSFATLITDLIGGIFDGVKGVFSFLGDLFTWPTSLGDEPFTFSGLISDAFTSAKDWFVGIFTWASEGIAGTFTSLSGFISEKFTAVKDWFVGIFTWAKDTATDDATWTFMTPIKDAFASALAWVKGIFTWGTEGIANSDWGFMTPVKDAFAAAIAWVTGIFSWGAEGPTVKGGITKFIDIVLAPYNLAVNWLMGLFGFSTPDGEPFSIGKVVMGAFTAAKDWIVGLFAWGKDAGTNAAGDFSFLTLVTGVFKSVKEWFLGLFAWGKETGTNAAGDFSLFTLIGGIFESVKEWFTGIFSFSTPDGESFSIVTMLVDSAKKIFDWFKGLLDFDFSALVMKIPGAETVLNFLGYGDETPELTEEEKNLESQKQRNMEIEQEKLDIQTRIAKFDAGENPYSWLSNKQKKRDEDAARLAQLNMEETPLAQLNMEETPLAQLNPATYTDSDGMVIEKVISQESAAKTAALISGNITASEIERSFKQQSSQMIVNAPSTTTVMAGGGGKIALPINMNDSGSAAIAANSNH